MEKSEGERRREGKGGGRREAKSQERRLRGAERTGARERESRARSQSEMFGQWGENNSYVFFLFFFSVLSFVSSKANLSLLLFFSGFHKRMPVICGYWQHHGHKTGCLYAAPHLRILKR